MLGRAIAAAPLGAAGLGMLTEGFPGAPERIRIDAVLGIMAEAAPARATGEPAMTIGRER